MGSVLMRLGQTWGYFRVLRLLSGGLFALAIGSLVKPPARVNFSLFKFASLSMLSSMVLLLLSGA